MSRPPVSSHFSCSSWLQALSGGFRVCLFLLIALPVLAEDTASQLFLEGYLQRTEGEKAEGAGEFKRAYDCYRNAARIYDQVARDFPEYNPSMVAFRRKGLADQITAVAERAAKMELGRTANDPRPVPPGVLAENPPPSSPSPSPGATQATRSPQGASVVVRPPVTAPASTDDPYARLRIQELERQQSGARQTMDALAKERNALKERLAEVENSRNLSSFESKKYRDERDAARKQLADLQEKGINSSVADKARISNLEKQVAEAENRLTQAEREAEKKAHAAAEMAREKSDALIAAKTAEFKTERDKLAKELTELKENPPGDANAQKSRIATLESQLADADKNLKLAEEKARADTRAELASETAKAREEAATARADAEKAHAEAAKTMAEAAKAMADATAKAKEELATEAAKVKSDRESLEREIADMQSKGLDISAKDKARITALEKQLADANKALKEAEEKASIAATAMAAQPPEAQESPEMKAQREELLRKLAAVEAQLAATQRDARQFEDTIRVLTAERDRWKAERDQLAIQLEAKSAEPQMLTTNQRLEKELAAARAELASLTSGRAEDAAKINELRDRLRVVEDELSVARKENAAYRDQMGNLEKRLAEARAQLDSAPLASQNPALLEENKTLKQIVIRQLRQQAYRSRARNLLLSELAKLEINSKALLQYIDQLEGKGSMPSPEEVTGIDDHEIRALAGVELSGKFFGSDEGSPDASGGGSESPATTAASAQDPAPSPGTTPPAAALTNRPDAAGAFDFQKRSLAQTAESAFLKRDFKQAEDIYRLIVEADPADARMQCNLGVALLKQERFGDAVDRFQDALAQNESNAFAHLMLGVCHWKLRESDLAVDRLNRSLVLEPSNSQSWLYLGLVATDNNKWRDAETAFKKALELKPDYALAHYNLAVIYSKPGFADPVQAKRCYDESLRLGGARDEAVELFLRIGATPPAAENFEPDSNELPTLDDPVPAPPPGAESVSTIDDLPKQ